MRNVFNILIVFLVLIIGVWGYWNRNGGENNIPKDMSKEYAFLADGLRTNTTQASIPLEKILDGGPGKDGIPALINPKFTSVEKAQKDVNDDSNGLVVAVGNTVKFYPYSIMVWHEVVNDTVGDKPLVITFCPLCGSAIVFEAEIGGKQEQFGVSGKLYESNLLMYDQRTESLWSQAIGTAVAGDRTEEKLTIYPSQFMSFADFKEKWPEGQVLSTDTGYSRNYQFYPYGDYNENEEIFFPISVEDSRFPAKEIMYVVKFKNSSVAFPYKQLQGAVASVNVGGEKITATIIDREAVAKDPSGRILPGYHEMWFSWAIHHQEDGVVWQK